jgi:phage baseplate assembly protein W
MASINFNVFRKPEVTTNKYLYSDLHLDFTNPINNDVKADYDMSAIKNSVVTLFNTLPGQNLLNPEYGLNLLQYLFEPASSTIARIIGAKIVKDVSLYEPRIRVQNVNVEVNPDEQMYTITLSISVPSLNKNVQIVGTLNREGFSLLA